MVTLPIATKVAGLSTTMPTLRSPMMIRNSPTPAEIATLSVRGMASIIHSRTGVSERATNRTPERNTAPRAVCHGTPMPITTL